MSTITPNLGLFKYNTTTDSATPFNINTALNANWDILDEKCGSSRNIGEIITSTIPLTDAGLHLLDGALINGSGIYSAFVTYISGLVSNYPDLFITESAYQTAISNYGVCGKFVYNSTNNTVRLPKITGIVEGTTDLTALGDLVEAGLPNIEGAMPLGTGSTLADYSTGAFRSYEDGYRWSVSSPATENRIKFDASLSNSIYGNSSTVQPQTIKLLYYIVIATTTKSTTQVDFDRITTELNNKVNSSDLVEVQCIVETYQNGNSWYRIYSDGWCEQGGSGTGYGTITFLKPFTDTTYNISFGITYTDDTAYTPTIQTTSKTTSNMTVSTRVNGSGVAYLTYDWQACGYAEI